MDGTFSRLVGTTNSFFVLLMVFFNSNVSSSNVFDMPSKLIAHSILTSVLSIANFWNFWPIYVPTSSTSIFQTYLDWTFQPCQLASNKKIQKRHRQQDSLFHDHDFRATHTPFFCSIWTTQSLLS